MAKINERFAPTCHQFKKLKSSRRGCPNVAELIRSRGFSLSAILQTFDKLKCPRGGASWKVGYVFLIPALITLPIYILYIGTSPSSTVLPEFLNKVHLDYETRGAFINVIL